MSADMRGLVERAKQFVRGYGTFTNATARLLLQQWQWLDDADAALAEPEHKPCYGCKYERIWGANAPCCECTRPADARTDRWEPREAQP